MEQNDKILLPTLLIILTKVAASLDGGIIGLNNIEVFGVLLDPNGESYRSLLVGFVLILMPETFSFSC